MTDRFRAVIFDFDGIIANTEPLHSEIFRRVLAEEGIAISDQDHDDRFLGINDWEGFLKAFEEVGRTLDDAGRRKLVERKSAYYRERVGGILPFSGVPELLADLAKRCPLAIASGGRRLEIEAVLENHGLRGHFSALVSADDVSRSKPAPDIFLRALAELPDATPPLTPRSCLVVEDSLQGIRAARSAEMGCLAVAHSLPAARLSEADRIVEGLAGLMADDLLS